MYGITNCMIMHCLYRQAHGQFTESPCLVNRIDILPCIFRSPSNTAVPAAKYRCTIDHDCM